MGGAVEVGKGGETLQELLKFCPADAPLPRGLTPSGCGPGPVFPCVLSTRCVPGYGRRTDLALFLQHPFLLLWVKSPTGGFLWFSWYEAEKASAKVSRPSLVSTWTCFSVVISSLDGYVRMMKNQAEEAQKTENKKGSGWCSQAKQIRRDLRC